MDGLKYIESTRKYLDYVEEHLLNIRQSWNLLQETCRDMRFIWNDLFYNSIGTRICEHDISKLGADELTQYRDWFFPVGEKCDESVFQKAWEHHKAHNPHHWENWTARDFYHPSEWEVHCVCMVVDWMAMGLKFGDTAQSYYEANRGKIILPDHAVDFIYEIFARLPKPPATVEKEEGHE
jgi:hypothetical protein